MALVLVTISALTGAIVSGLFGIAGGAILMGALWLALPMSAAIPVHGAVLLTANSSRMVVYRRHIDLPVCLYFSVGMLAALFLGVELLKAFSSEKTLRLLVGCGVFLGALLNSLKKNTTTQPRKYLGIFAGMIAGSIGVVIGVVGPMMAPFLLWAGLEKEAFVGTKAVCQTIGHLCRVIVFGLAMDFQFGHHAVTILILSVAVVVGTLVAKKLMKRISVQLHQKVVNRLLMALGISMLISVALQ